MKYTGVNLLDELAREELSELRSVFVERSYAKGAVVFQPGIGEDRVFILSKGRVRIYLAYEEKEFTLGILGPGDLFSTHANSYIQTLEESTLLVTDVQSVKRCMTEIPAFTRTMVRVLGNILRNSVSIIDGLVFKDVYKRLVDFILAEAEHGKPAEDGSVPFELDLTIDQLSKLLGATRQSVSTLLNDMERAGLMVKEGRGHYRIPDLDALRQVAGE